MFSPLHRQPSMCRHAELFFKYPAERVQRIAAHFRQTVGIFRFAVVGEYQTFEGHVFIGHRMEEQPQFFGRIVLGEEPYQFLMFQSPQGRFVFLIMEVTAHAIHQVRQLPAGGQFAVKVRFARLMFNGRMAVQEREQAVLHVTHHIAEIVYQQYGIAQCHAVVIAATGYEQDFSGTQKLFLEQIACYADMA